MIGIRELASLLASAVVLFGSVSVPLGDEGTVAVETIGGDVTRAVADEPVHVELAETKAYELVTSRGAPIPPASLEGGFETIRFVTAPGASTSAELADREMPIPAGSTVRLEGFTGTVDVADEEEGLALALAGAATGMQIEPIHAPTVETHSDSGPTIPATNVTLGGDLVSGSIEQGGSFDEITFTITPPSDPSASLPSLDVDTEVFPFEQTVRVRVADFVGLVAVAEVERESVSLALDGFGNVTILGDDYERQIHQEVEVSASNPNRDPVADFSYNPGQPQAGETVSFESRSEDDVVLRSWEWDFGDGTTSQAQHPEHTYATSGEYEVSLTVTDVTGRTDSRNETLDVVNSRPTVSLEFDPETMIEGELVELTANASDRDGEIITYDWTIPNRTAPTGSSVNHTFAEEGFHEVEVVVTDDEGAQAEASETVEVENAAPVANFTVEPSEPMARQTVYLESASSDYGDGEIVEYDWEIPTVGFREGEIVEVEFPHDGEREVTLEVRDDDGATDTITRTVDVRNAPPDAEIRIHPQPLNPSSPIEFSADVTDGDPIEQSEWTFSDGVERNGLSVTRSFTEGGAYDLTLRLQDADGAWSTFEKTFYVNEAPDLTLGPLGHPATEELAVETSELFTLTARIDDPDSEEISLSWSVDGAPPTGLSHCTHAPNGNESRMQCGWPDDGQHRIDVHARDEQGATTTSRIDVLVLNQPPTLNPDLLTDVVNVGELVQMKANAEDVDGQVEDIVWRIDGESVDVGPGLHYTFQEAGTHDVTVNATDDDGAVGSTTFQVDVNAKPEADITFTPEEPVAGEAIDFSADAHDPDGADSELSYEWSFGDGTHTSGSDVTHTYTFADSYIVQLNVTDEAGATSVRQLAIDVDTPDLGADLSVSPSAPQAGQSVTFTVDIEDDRQIEGIDWNFGDGTSETTGQGVDSITHTYATPHTFAVTVEIDADYGEQRRLNSQVRVTGAEGHQVVLEPRLPDDQCLDVGHGQVEVLARNLQTGKTVGLQDGDDAWQISSPCTLRYTFPAGTWSTRDQLTVTVEAGSAEHIETYELGVERPLEDRSLRMLQAPLSFEDVGIVSPTQESQSDEDETYANPAEAVYVTGQVVWVEGTLASDIKVETEVTYRTPTDTIGIGATYYDDSFRTPEAGSFQQEVPAPVLAASPGVYTWQTGPSAAYLPGQYHVDLGVNSGAYGDHVSQSFVEDPAGIFAALAQP